MIREQLLCRGGGIRDRRIRLVEPVEILAAVHGPVEDVDPRHVDRGHSRSEVAELYGDGAVHPQRPAARVDRLVSGDRQGERFAAAQLGGDDDLQVREGTVIDLELGGWGSVEKAAHVRSLSFSVRGPDGVLFPGEQKDDLARPRFPVGAYPLSALSHDRRERRWGREAADSEGTHGRG
ncbi:hypothetical protein ACFDTO_07880 [Microbacteriaceae bacterium 4G12]